MQRIYNLCSALLRLHVYLNKTGNLQVDSYQTEFRMIANGVRQEQEKYRRRLEQRRFRRGLKIFEGSRLIKQAQNDRLSSLLLKRIVCSAVFLHTFSDVVKDSTSIDLLWSQSKPDEHSNADNSRDQNVPSHNLHTPNKYCGNNTLNLFRCCCSIYRQDQLPACPIRVATSGRRPPHTRIYATAAAAIIRIARQYLQPRMKGANRSYMKQ